MIILTRLFTALAVSLLTGVLVVYLTSGTAFYMWLAIACSGLLLVMSTLLEYFTEKEKARLAERKYARLLAQIQELATLLQKDRQC